MTEHEERIAALSPQRRQLLERLLAAKGRANKGLPRRPDPGWAPLTNQQRRLWLLNQLTPDSVAYNVYDAVRLTGGVDTERLQAALDHVERRHEALRTNIIERSGAPLQLVHSPRGVPLTARSVAASPDPVAAALAMVNREASLPVDLASDRLFRAVLLELAVDDHMLGLLSHHIVTDGWSVDLLRSQIAAAYAAPETTAGPIESRPDYGDYAWWQQSSSEGAADLEYWRDTLAGAPLASGLVPDRPRPRERSTAGDQVEVALPPDLTERLVTLGRDQATTPFIVFASLFAMMLARESGDEDLCIGTPVSGRDARLHDLVGLFINNLVLRLRVQRNDTFGEVLERTRRTVLEALDHQDAAFEDVVRAVVSERDPSRSPLFQVMLVLQPEPDRGDGAVDGLSTAVESSHNGSAKFDLTLNIARRSDTYVASFEFATDIFDKDTIERFAARFVRLTDAAITGPDRELRSLRIGDAREEHETTHGHNRTEAALDAGSVADWIVERSAQHPEGVAIREGSRVLTFGEYERASNALANALRDAGARPGDIVGLAIERSADYVVAALATLRAGAAFLPLDPEFPALRLPDMCADAKPAVVVTRPGDSRLADGPTILEIERGWVFEEREAEPRCLEPVPAGALAYVIYTSGSTGRPKGAMCTHGGLANRLAWMKSALSLSPTDCVLHKTPMSFDVSVWELFLSPLAGAELAVLAPGAHTDPVAVASSIDHYGVTLLHFVPSMLREYVATVLPDPGGSVRTVVTSGEALLPADVDAAVATLGAEVVNLYGPTEASIDVSAWICGPGAPTVPIGRPIWNTRLYVLDDELNPSPVGVPGELYIGGMGLARGYLGRPSLTAEVFIPDPFTFGSGARMYRTGDRARIRPGGAIEYLGRLDDQLKVRGVRIEPREVEAALGAHASLDQVAVVPHTASHGVQLVAFWVGDGAVTSEELWAWAHSRLPASHVPSHFIHADALPRTVSGKIDRSKLQVPPSTETARSSEPPRTATERRLADVWCDVLDRDLVGVDENFFAVGGDSILAIRIVSRAAERGLQFNIRDLFDHATIRALAGVVKGRTTPQAVEPVGPFDLIGQADQRLVSPSIEAAYPLTSLQLAMVYETERLQDHAIYHDVFSFHLAGRLEPNDLQSALDDLVKRHEVLRTSLDLGSFAEPLQLVHRSGTATVEVVDLGHLSHAEQDVEIAAALRRERDSGFDWASAPLFRVLLHQRGANGSQFTFSCHNVILDGWSVATLLRELLDRLDDRSADGHSAQRPLPVPFREYVALEGRATASDQSRGFWLDQLDVADHAPVPRLPIPGDEMFRGRASWDVELPSGLLADLEELAAKLKVPIKSVLLGVHLVVLARVNGVRRPCTGVVTNGRLDGADSDQALGLFLNVVPFSIDLELTASWADAATEAFEAERRMMPHRRYPMSYLRASTPRTHWFEVAFNFVNFHVYAGLRDSEDLNILGTDLHDDTNMTLWVEPSIDPLTSELRLHVAYDAGELSESHVARIGQTYGRALRAAATTPDDPIASLPSANDGGNLVGPTAPVHAAHSIWDLFVSRVDADPSACAFRMGPESLSFGALRARADALASELTTRGVKPGDAVGVYLDRGFDVPAALLAIWALEAVYVPLDPVYPHERLRLMAEDAAVRLVVSNGKVSGIEVEHVSMSPDGLPSSVEFVGAGVAVDDPAYIVFTSGSTGRPKGVRVPHAQILNRLSWMWDAYPFNGGEVGAFKTSVSFVDSLWELLGPLLAGVPSVIVDDGTVRDSNRLLALLATAEVSRIWLVPSLLRAILDEHPDLRMVVPSLRFWVVSGEPLPADLADQFSAALPEGRLYNLYGTSEVWDATWFDPDLESVRPSDTVPIGRPITNTSAVILDLADEPAEVGAPGELCIGGIGLGEGYLNDPALTAARFVPDPAGAPGARRYRTGDRACVLPDGNVHHLGRIDAQVKIRGVRVEPAEIELVLRRFPGVANAVVIVADAASSVAELCAYVVFEAEPVAPAELRAFVRHFLPSALQPSRYFAVEHLPRTPSGKLNRAALGSGPAAELVAGSAGRPRTPDEELLCELFEELLEVDGIGTRDDFFERGGHSLHAMQLISRIRTVTHVDLPLAHVFETPTVAGLARSMQALRLGQSPGRPRLTKRPHESNVQPASSAQQRLWFVQQLDTASPAFNVHIAAMLDGPLDPQRLRRAVDLLVDRHESLRTTFRLDDEVWQVIHETMPVRVDEIVLEPGAGADAAEMLRTAATPFVRQHFDLEAGPLLHVAAITIPGTDDVGLVITAHHIVCDGWSMELLGTELGAFYQAGVGAELPPLPVQYRDYASWQSTLLDGDHLTDLVRRWQRRLDGAATTPLFQNESGDGGSVVEVHAGDDAVREIRALGRARGVTMFIAALAAFDVVLRHHTGRSDLTVGTDVAGRSEIELEPMIGFFVNQLPLRVKVDDHATFDELLQEVRAVTLEAYDLQDLPFDVLVDRLSPDRARDGSHPIFQVKLVHQNVPDGGRPVMPDAVSLGAERGTAQLPLNVRMAEHGDGGLVLSAEHAVGSLDAATVRLILEQLLSVLAAAAADPSTSLDDLDRMLVAMDRTRSEVTREKMRSSSGAGIRASRRRSSPTGGTDEGA